MTTVALRGLFGRKLRTVLTAFAIVLGVAMVSGGFLLTDSMSKAFDRIFASSYANTDAVVSGRSLTAGEAGKPYVASTRCFAAAFPSRCAASKGLGRFGSLAGSH